MKYLPLFLFIFTSYVYSSSATLVPRTAQKVHNLAFRQTRNLVRDLRIAFRGVLVSQLSERSTQQVPLCIPSRPNDPNSNTDSENSSSAGQSGRTSRRPSSRTRTATSTRPTNTAQGESPWKLVETHQGNGFYDGWSFFTGSDPTHGAVQYITQEAAKESGLLEINGAGNAIMRLETTPRVQNTRQSIRISTKSSFNGGLFVMEATHMPTGCGVWPAFWTNGPSWPTTGEIDIVEGVHDYTNNQATVHTNSGCTLSSNTGFSGKVIGGTDCAALTTGNQGCGIRASTDNSFGAAFNKNGGGTYAMKWDASGVAVYFFPNGSMPADLSAGAPDPNSWGLPQARWPANGCDPFEFFKDHSLIFDTTLCGDWAGAVWNGAGIPGQAQSCAQRTGVSTCQAHVAANGDAFQEAYWEVKSVKVFQHQ